MYRKISSLPLLEHTLAKLPMLKLPMLAELSMLELSMVLEFPVRHVSISTISMVAMGNMVSPKGSRRSSSTTSKQCPGKAYIMI